MVETTDRSRDITTYQLDADGNLVVIETINVKYVKQGLPWSDTIGPVTRVYKRNNF